MAIDKGFDYLSDLFVMMIFCLCSLFFELEVFSVRTSLEDTIGFSRMEFQLPPNQSQTFSLDTTVLQPCGASASAYFARK